MNKPQEKPKSTAVATPKQAGLPAMVADFEQDKGAGMEQAHGREHFAIPFLTILQGLSPAVQEGRDGAKPGRIINSVTGDIVDELFVIPVRYTRTFVEWVPRDAGGGFRGEFPENEREEEFQKLRDPKSGKVVLENGNELSDTRNFYVLVADTEAKTVSPAIISLSSTQIKKARTWLMMMNLKKLPGKDGKPFTPAMYAHVFRLTAQQEENKKGKWHGWRIEWRGFIDDSNQYEEGRMLNKQISAGAITMDRSQTEAPSDPVDDPDNL